MDKTPLPKELRDFKEQLLRWNAQINLVSRQSPSQRIDDLIEQARTGIEAVVGHLHILAEAEERKAEPGLDYFDLGSGGGIPGIVWLLRLTELGFFPATCLVEPRIKRAWFLERLGKIPGMPPFSVLCDRWGEDARGEQPRCPGLQVQLKAGEDRPPRPILISLKALKLDDRQILAGLARVARGGFREGGLLLIVRYFPPDQQWSRELASQLGIPAAGDHWKLTGFRARASRAWIQALEGSSGPSATLVFSEYTLHGA